MRTKIGVIVVFATLCILSFNGKGSASSNNQDDSMADAPIDTMTDLFNAVNGLRAGIISPKRRMKREFRTMKGELREVKEACTRPLHFRRKRWSSVASALSERLRLDDSMAEATRTATIDDIDPVINDLRKDIRGVRRIVESNFRSLDSLIKRVKNKCGGPAIFIRKRLSDEGSALLPRQLQDDSIAEETNSPVTIAKIAPVVNGIRADIRDLGPYIEDRFQSMENSLTGVNATCAGPSNVDRNPSSTVSSATFHRQLQDDSTEDATNSRILTIADIAPVVNDIRADIRNLWSIMNRQFVSMGNLLKGVKTTCAGTGNFNLRQNASNLGQNGETKTKHNNLGQNGASQEKMEPLIINYNPIHLEPSCGGDKKRQEQK